MHVFRVADSLVLIEEIFFGLCVNELELSLFFVKISSDNNVFVFFLQLSPYTIILLRVYISNIIFYYAESFL